MMFTKPMLAAALLVGAAAPASAALFLSGDSNIYMSLTTSLLPSVNPGNQAFFSNILEGGGHVVTQFGYTHVSVSPNFISGYYSTLGVTTTVLPMATTLDFSDLYNASLFIGVLPGRDYTASEVAVLAWFLAAGGNVLISGENSGFPTYNTRVNTLLASLGSGMRLVPATLDANALFTAQLQGPSRYLSGTSGFSFGATSAVTGGVGLFGTETADTTFLAVEGEEPVPEPATWSLLIAGFTLTGTALRRRRAVAA